MSDTKIGVFGDQNTPWRISEVDLARQAVPSLRGYVYQLHQSASAWISLSDSDLLHLEVAEDYSQVLRDPSGIDQVLLATQVKDTRESGRVNLNSSDVLDAIESLFRLRTANPGREVRLRFLTTSEIGKERKNALASGAAGIEAWYAVASGGQVTELRAALLNRVEAGELKTFLTQCSEEDFRQKIVAPLTFVCGEQPWQSIEADNRNRLMAMHEELQSTPDMAHGAYDSVLGYIITTILSSSTRMLDRSQLISCLKRATSIAVPSALVMKAWGATAHEKASAPIDIADLRALARTLLDLASPPSMMALFPDAAQTARAAMTATAAVRRSVKAPNGTPTTELVDDLPAMPERAQLIIGPPGSGKSHALWRCARQLLDTGKLVPLYLPVAQLTRWSEVTSLITDAAPHLSVDTVLGDPRICVCLDGWSEFATGESAAEKRKALRAMRSVRVLANGKIAEVEDSAFKVWSLEPLSVDLVTKTLRTARPGDPVPSPAVLDLLRLPLLLSIHVLSGANAGATGELLRQFHEHLAANMPEGLTEALAGAVAALDLANNRSFGRLTSELQARATGRGIAEPSAMLRRLGTIVERNAQALPIHDLYWSWLVGRGLVAEHLTADAMKPLRTRDSYALALQSGAFATAADVRSLVQDDLVLAATLDTSRNSSHPEVDFSTSLVHALSDPRLAVRSRAGLAALASGRSRYLQRALEILADITRAGLYMREWQQALRPDALFPNRTILADWMGSKGSELVLTAIAEHGGPEWIPWLEQMAVSGKVGNLDSLATALACGSDIPAWGRAHLDELLRSQPWKLRSAANRQANLPLARLIAADYGRVVDAAVPQNSMAGFHLNRVMVSCGDDDVFRSLLERFDSMSSRAQEVLEYAVVERGSPWIAAFQKVAFATPGARHHHKLIETPSQEIDDATARAWIAAGYDEVGWRVLIAHHGASIVPELVAELPHSFGGLHDIPALATLRFVEQAPVSLISELWGRLGNPMQPKATQDVLDALATVYPEGVVSIVRLIYQQPSALPSFHLAQAVRLYEQWRKRMGASIGVKLPSGEIVPFERWIVLHCAVQQWHDHFTPMILATWPDLAVEAVLERLQNDLPKEVALLSALKNVTTYHARLLDRMLSDAKLAALIPDVFGNCFDTFPADALQRCVDSADIQQHALLFRLSTTSNPLHRSVHAVLIRRVLGEPINLHHYRYVANTLSAYTRHDVLLDLRRTISPLDDNAIFFMREVEAVRGERLIDEAGNLHAA